MFHKILVNKVESINIRANEETTDEEWEVVVVTISGREYVWVAVDDFAVAREYVINIVSEIQNQQFITVNKY